MINGFFRTKTKDIGRYHVGSVFNKKRNGDLIVSIPEEIQMAYNIEVGDAAVFEVNDEQSLIVRFVKKGLWSVTEKIKEAKKNRQDKTKLSHTKKAGDDKNVRKPIKI